LLQAENWSLKTRQYTLKVREINDRLMMAERAFTNREGLAGRPWYKHMVSRALEIAFRRTLLNSEADRVTKHFTSFVLLQIYASSDQDDWGTKAFPGIVSVMDKAKKSNTTETWRSLQHEIYRVARAVSKASAVLDGKP
jgi:N-acetylated-alpha-linked acidic dipeptidase